MKLSAFIGIALAMALATLPAAKAVMLPWLEPANTRLYQLDDHRVDMALRIAAIDAATVDTPILLITYNLGVDRTIGLPILQALRRAADRGVSVRVLSSKIPSSIFDRGGLARRMLTDRTLRRPIEFIEFGGLNNLKVGLNLSDSIHQKILKIGDKLAFFGGRNTDKEVRFLDLSFAVRPLDEGQPSLASQLSFIAEDVWAMVRRLQQPYKPMILPGVPVTVGRLPYDYENGQIELDTQERRQAYQSGISFLASPGESPPSPLETRPQGLCAINNDCIGTALTRIHGRSMVARSHMPDEIVDYVAALISRGREIDLVAMSLFTVPKIKEALVTALHRGARVRILTNSLKSARAFVPLGLSYLESLPLMLELLQIGGDNLSIYTMVPNEEFNYLHMKALRVDDTVLLGSSNFNVPSTTSNDEVGVPIHDPVLARTFEAKIDTLVANQFTNVNCEMALSENNSKRTLVRRLLSSLFKVFY